MENSGREFGRWLVAHPAGEQMDLSSERKATIFDVMSAAPDLVQAWVEETKEGKEWLSEVAAKTGVPLQIALPFGGNEQ
jgi:hypothetical protein